MHATFQSNGRAVSRPLGSLLVLFPPLPQATPGLPPGPRHTRQSTPQSTHLGDTRGGQETPGGIPLVIPPRMPGGIPENLPRGPPGGGPGWINVFSRRPPPAPRACIYPSWCPPGYHQGTPWGSRRAPPGWCHGVFPKSYLGCTSRGATGGAPCEGYSGGEPG